jgi:protein tyrosine phosphatase (PTP) superfamily phosphohydrolase (DUF442 family)
LADKSLDDQVVRETPAEIAADRTGLIRLLNPFGRIWLRIVARLLEWASDIVPTKLNLSWVTTTLAVGGAPRKRDYRRLAAAGITAVVDCREEASDDPEALGRVGIRLLRLPTEDRYGLSQEHLEEGARWTLDRMTEGGKVLVHCQHGVGRAPLLGSAVLIAQGLSAPEALKTVRAKRWQSAPNDRQIESLLVFEEQWKNGKSTPDERLTEETAPPR